MLIYHSKANLDLKILFGYIIHLIDPEIRKMLEIGFVWESRFHIPFWSMIYLILKLNSFLKLTIAFNSNFDAKQIMDQNGMWNSRFQYKHLHFSDLWVLMTNDVPKKFSHLS